MSFANKLMLNGMRTSGSTTDSNKKASQSSLFFLILASNLLEYIDNLYTYFGFHAFCVAGDKSSGACQATWFTHLYLELILGMQPTIFNSSVCII